MNSEGKAGSAHELAGFENPLAAKSTHICTSQGRSLARVMVASHESSLSKELLNRFVRRIHAVQVKLGLLDILTCFGWNNLSGILVNNHDI